MKLYDLHRRSFRAFSDTKHAPLEMRQRQKLRTNPNDCHTRYFNTHVQGQRPGSFRHQNTPSDRSRTVTIIHEVQSSLSLTDIKQIPSIRKILITHNCYLRPHYWQSSDKDIKSLGWFLNINPSHQSREFTKIEIQEKIKDANANKKVTIPEFQIILNNPSLSQSNTNPQKKKTQAYAIETRSSDKNLLMKLLLTTFATEKTFIPYYFIRRDKGAFAKAIDVQNTFLSSNKVIVLHHILEDIMFFLKERILSIPNVTKLIPTHKSVTIGEYKVTVPYQQFSSVRKCSSRLVSRVCR